MPMSPSLAAATETGSSSSSSSIGGGGFSSTMRGGGGGGGGGSSSGSLGAEATLGSGAAPTRAYGMQEAGASSGSIASVSLSPRARARHASQDTGTLRSAKERQHSLAEKQSLEFSPVDELYAQLDKEEKIREGAQSILQLISQDGFASSSNKLPSAGAAAALRAKVEAELYAAEDRIMALQTQIQAYSRVPLDEPPLSTAYMDLNLPFSSPSPSPRTEPLLLQPVSPVSVPAGPLPVSSQTESIPDALESEAAESEAEDPHSTGAARSLVLSLLQSIQNLIEDGAYPFAGSFRTTTGSFGQATFNDFASPARVQFISEHGTLSMAATNSVLELLDRLFTVLRRSTRLRYEFLGQQPFRTNLGPAHSTIKHGDFSDDSADEESDDSDDGFAMDPLLDTFIRLLADHVGEDVRAKTYRLISHLLVHPSTAFLARCRTRGLDLYLCRTLTRDAKYDQERIEVLRLIRRANELSEHTRGKKWDCGLDEDDNEHSSSGRKGKRRRTDDALEPDEPERQYLRPGLDLEVALFPITDVPFKKPSLYEAEVRAGVKAVCVILRSWSGLMYMCMHQRRSVGSIVRALVAGTRESKEAVIKMLQDLFELAQGRVKSGTASSTPVTTPALRHMYSRATMATTPTSPPPANAPLPFGPPVVEKFTSNAAGHRPQVIAGPPRPNLLEQYATLLLAVFVDAGIIDALVHIVEATPGPLITGLNGTDDIEAARGLGMAQPSAEEHELAENRRGIETSRRAVRLLGTVMQVARRLLPLEDALNVQSLPRLFALAAHLQTDTAQPVFRKGKAFASLRSRAPLVQQNGFRTMETSALSAAGRGMATSALSALDYMDRPKDMRLAAANGVVDARNPRVSSDTIMPGDSSHTPVPLSTSSFTSGATTLSNTPNLDNLQSSGNPKSPDSPATQGTLSPVPDEAARRAQQRNVELAKVRAGMQMDDAHFRHLLLESQVLTHKEHAKWNLAAINELLEGPLLNPRRLEEVTRGSKFVRRLLSFFHPSEQRFSLIPNTAANRKYVRLGCTMFRAFLATSEGVKVLAEDPLLKEIRSAIELLDPLSMGQSGGPMPTGDQLMSKARVEETLTYGYFEMIGILSRYHEGLDLLQRVQMFTVLYNLSGVQSRDYLIREIIKNFDYSIDGHTRIILSKVLTSTYRNMRIFATRTLTGLIAKSIEPSQWLIALLLTQLYDTASEVRELAVRAVMQACTSPAVLELVVSMRPTLEHLGEDSHPLLLRFMSSSNGFRFLFKGDYIIREMEDWLNTRNLRYTLRLELLLGRALSIDDLPEPSSQNATAGAERSAEGTSSERQFAPESRWQGALEAFDGTVPPHFFGEMAKTAEGCALLEEKGHFSEFASFIRRHGKESDDVEIIAKLKSMLWTVGNIGVNHRGLNFLEAEDIISVIVEIAERSKVLSVRGVAYFVIGMISSTPQGAEVLQDYGWRTAWTSMGLPAGVCIPDDIDRFVEIEPWTPVRARSRSYSELMYSADPVERDILSALSELGNGIVAKLAHRELLKLKALYREYFEDMGGASVVNLRSTLRTSDANMTPTLGSMEDSIAAAQQEHDAEFEPSKRLVLLVRALELLDHYPLPMSMRRAIWDLFDVRLDEGFVREIARTRQRLINERQAWERSIVAADGAGGGGVEMRPGDSHDSSAATLDGKDSGLGATARRRYMPVNTPGPGTAAYAAVVGLRDVLVAGGARPAMQIQMQREWERARAVEGGGPVGSAAAAAVAGTRRASTVPGGMTASFRDGAKPGVLSTETALAAASVAGLGVGEEEEEEDDDTDEDSDAGNDRFAGVQRRANGELARGGGPAVVISTATHDSGYPA
ncbi:hypothetical protein OC842_003969 [Tilletia horrida]|uniref:REM-1 domain-containing protein n=1 Tax=Tilletia horrida TaxID=155126 RepID=A0AAN6GAP2_9BASI|nr:hypothetical protein OC842_003969 [Tilletia horrida]